MTDYETWKQIRNEILAIPHWRDPETARGGFDLQPLGPHESSEEGAFNEVMAAFERTRPKEKE